MMRLPAHRWTATAAFLLSLMLAPLAGLAQTQTTPGTDTGLIEGAVKLTEALTEVQAGAYILRLSNVSARDGSFDVDMWLWFRWQGTEARPHETFELANGVITARTEAEVLDDQGFNYATLRVQATIFHEFDVRRFPLDDHVITIDFEDSSLEDTNLIYVADQGIALDPDVTAAGWAVSLGQPSVVSHPYETNYGFRSSGVERASYSRLTVPIILERTSYGQLFKQFWVSILAVVLALLALLVKSDDLDARFGMAVGAIFAASASAFVISDSLPKTTVVTLAEQINLIAVGIIFLTVFISIWSLRLRYAERPEASERLDRITLVAASLLYIGLNVLVLTVDLS